jgi:hypothetical protein
MGIGEMGNIFWQGIWQNGPQVRIDDIKCEDTHLIMQLHW